MQFHERLKTARNYAGITQREVASRLGITERAYQWWESGHNEPSLTNLVKLASFYSVSMDWLAGLTDNPTPAEPSEER